MRFENIRVSFKLAFSLGGLMLLMFLVALWAQQHAANTTASNERLIADYEQRIATALEWA
ncbi:MAG: methyl-accepting chemotaxis protein, partial [Comamonas sp.]|nr:methyl-accepting chemotaxis protein [Comamonas sp.]